jgi:hypothetical protein
MAIKGPQLALLVWLATFGVLVGGGAVGYKVWTGITESRSSAYDRAGNPQLQQNRVEWQSVVASEKPEDIRAFRGAMLTPRPRPRPATERPPPPPPPPPQERSDEELRKEVEEWVNREFKLLRIYDARQRVAIVTLNGVPTPLSLFAGMTFKEDLAFISHDKIKTLREKDNISIVDVVIVHGQMNQDHVIFRLPARDPKYEERFFEVPLRMPEGVGRQVTPSQFGRSVAGTGVGRVTPPNTGARPSDTTVETPPPPTPPTQSTFDEATNTWNLGTEDYMNIDVDELARHARAVYDSSGRPIGIQIADTLPEGSVVSQRGGRRGDIIKSINGVPVRAMADVRRIVREQYNAGTVEFDVIFERDGDERRQTFRAPRE